MAQSKCKLYVIRHIVFFVCYRSCSFDYITFIILIYFSSVSSRNLFMYLALWWFKSLVIWMSMVSFNISKTITSSVSVMFFWCIAIYKSRPNRHNSLSPKSWFLRSKPIWTDSDEVLKILKDAMNAVYYHQINLIVKIAK